MQRNKVSFKGQTIYIGIDVHMKAWHVTLLTESGNVRRLSIGPSAQTLFEILKKHYPDGAYRAVYESGFSGFATYYSLQEVGIDCIVIHAADVPTTQYESVMKTDRIDSEKLARSLRAGLLKGIYIRKRENIDDRSVIRLRKTVQVQISGYKARVKHLLHTNGVVLPERFAMAGPYWSEAFTKWLKEDVRLLSATRTSLDLLILQVESLRANLLKINLEIRWLSQTDRYREKFNLLLSIPGIGTYVAMTILTEIFDASRFHNERQFASYLGLIPTCHSSGEKDVHGEKTFRGNKKLGPAIVETCWVAIRKDIGLSACYSNYKQRMTSQEAIIRIARKMANIIYSVLKTGFPYVPYQVNI